MSEEIKGKFYQEHEPTPDNPCEIKTILCNDIEIPIEYLKQALLDIKEYIETECNEEYCTNSRLYITDGLKRDLIFKINKVLGSDSNE